MFPPPHVLQQMRLPSQGWRMNDHQGKVAITWHNQKVVLQCRSVERLDRLLALFELQQESGIPGVHMLAHPQIEIPGGQLVEACLNHEPKRIWTLYPYINSSRRLFYDGMRSHRLYESCDLVIKEVAHQLEAFAQNANVSKLSNLKDTRGLHIQKLSAQQILGLAESFAPSGCDLNKLSSMEEPNSEKVPSHGDSILKNTLLSNSGVHVIDWETIDMLPRHMDFTHWTAFACKYSHPEYWPMIIDQGWRHFAPYLPGWDREDWQVSSLWYLLREAVGHPLEDPKALHQYWSGFSDLINRL